MRNYKTAYVELTFSRPMLYIAFYNLVVELTFSRPMLYIAFYNLVVELTFPRPMLSIAFCNSVTSSIYSVHRVAGIFRSAKVSFFRSVTSRNENWTHIVFSGQNGRGLSVIWKNGIKTDEIQSITKKRNFGLTKYTRYMVYDDMPFKVYTP